MNSILGKFLTTRRTLVVVAGSAIALGSLASVSKADYIAPGTSGASTGSDAPLSANGVDPVYEFSVGSGNVTGNVILDTKEVGTTDAYYATAGSLSLTVGGTTTVYTLNTGVGPGVTLSPTGDFNVDNLVYPNLDANTASSEGIDTGLTSGAGASALDYWGLLFSSGPTDVNIWGNGANSISLYQTYAGQAGLQLTLQSNGGTVSDFGLAPASVAAEFAPLPSASWGGFALLAVVGAFHFLKGKGRNTLTGLIA
jgi:hypothetical protein